MTYSLGNELWAFAAHPRVKKKLIIFTLKFMALKPSNRMNSKREGKIYLLNIFLGVTIPKYLGREAGRLWK